MVFMSVTRLRLRSWLQLPAFARRTVGALRQARSAPGFLGGRLLPDRRLTFWTLTAWESQDAMGAYITSGDHLAVMPKLLDWCDQASVAHWTQDSADLPSWETADARMRTEGRASKVRRPAPHHADLSFETPRTTASAPIVALRR